MNNNTQVQDKPKAEQTVFTPVTDIYEQDNVVHIVAEMPGVNDKNLEVTIDNNILTVAGTPEAPGFEGYQQQCQGYQHGTYKRNFRLMPDIDQGNIKAQIANGVLRLELPKAEKAQPKHIEINLN